MKNISGDYKIESIESYLKIKNILAKQNDDKTSLGYFMLSSKEKKFIYKPNKESQKILASVGEDQFISYSESVHMNDKSICDYPIGFQINTQRQCFTLYASNRTIYLRWITVLKDIFANRTKEAVQEKKNSISPMKQTSNGNSKGFETIDTLNNKKSSASKGQSQVQYLDFNGNKGLVKTNTIISKEVSKGMSTLSTMNMENENNTMYTKGQGKMTKNQLNDYGSNLSNKNKIKEPKSSEPILKSSKSQTVLYPKINLKQQENGISRENLEENIPKNEKYDDKKERMGTHFNTLFNDIDCDWENELAVENIQVTRSQNIQFLKETIKISPYHINKKSVSPLRKVPEYKKTIVNKEMKYRGDIVVYDNSSSQHLRTHTKEDILVENLHFGIETQIPTPKLTQSSNVKSQSTNANKTSRRTKNVDLDRSNVFEADGVKKAIIATNKDFTMNITINNNLDNSVNYNFNEQSMIKGKYNKKNINI